MTVIFKAGTRCCKNDIQREITKRQHKVELQLLGTALLNIATNKHTKFQVIPPQNDKLLPQTSKKCYKNEGQIGKNNSKFVVGRYGSCAMHSMVFQQSCISNLKMLRLQMTVILQTSRKCCKNFNQRKMTHRHNAVQLWFFHTALCIIATIHKCQVSSQSDRR